MEYTNEKWLEDGLLKCYKLKKEEKRIETRPLELKKELKTFEEKNRRTIINLKCTVYNEIIVYKWKKLFNKIEHLKERQLLIVLIIEKLNLLGINTINNKGAK